MGNPLFLHVSCQSLLNFSCTYFFETKGIAQILGIDSQFCNVESFVTGIVDNWPELRKNRKTFVIGSVLVLFLISLPMLTKVCLKSIKLISYSCS